MYDLKTAKKYLRRKQITELFLIIKEILMFIHFEISTL